jgi:hypothetical protein
MKLREKMSAAPGPATEARDRPRPLRSLWRLDSFVAALLAAGAFVARRGVLPRDGLWHDDAVTAAGAVKGSTSQLLVTGFDHPGFTLGLRAWDRFAGYDAASFAVPAFVAGLLGPPSSSWHCAGLAISARSARYSAPPSSWPTCTSSTPDA